MSYYEFSLEVGGFDMEDDATLDLLYETFDDVSAGSVNGQVTVEFVVEAEGSFEALFNTLRRFMRAFPHADVLRLASEVADVGEGYTAGLERAADLLSRCPTCGSTSPCWSIFRVGRGRCEDDFHDGACRCEAVQKIARTAARRELSRRTRAADLLDGDR